MLFDGLIAISGALFLVVVVRAELRFRSLEQEIEDLGAELIMQRREIELLRGLK